MHNTLSVGEIGLSALTHKKAFDFNGNPFGCGQYNIIIYCGDSTLQNAGPITGIDKRVLASWLLSICTIW